MGNSENLFRLRRLLRLFLFISVASHHFTYHLNMTGRKNRALQVPLVVPYKALEKFSKALYGATGGTWSARFFRPVMHIYHFDIFYLMMGSCSEILILSNYIMRTWSYIFALIIVCRRIFVISLCSVSYPFPKH